MQMIDVLQRLAQLDAKNPKVVKESTVQECGPMGMMDHMSPMSMEKPSVPANFNISASAASGVEVADMMSQILTLAGLQKVGSDQLGHEPHGAVVTAEPVMSVGPMAAEPMSAADSMRSVIDKLNPEVGDDKGEELGPFQHDSEGPQTGNDAGDDEPKGDDETDEGNAFGQAVQNTAPGEEIKINGQGTGEIKKAEEGQYDNSPADPTDPPAADADEYAHHENQPGSGETSNGEKRQSNLPTATYESLMKEYRKFLGEGEDDPEMDQVPDDEDLEEETCPSCHKDPCSCEKTEETANESTDILKLAGLR